MRMCGAQSGSQSIDCPLVSQQQQEVKVELTPRHKLNRLMERVKMNRGFASLLKCYILLSILISLTVHTFVTVKYTLKENGGIVSLNYTVHHFMQFLLIFSSHREFSLDQITYLLTPANKRIFKRNKSICLFWNFTLGAFCLFSLFTFIYFYGQREFNLSGYGLKANQVEDPFLNQILFFSGFNQVVSVFATSFIFIGRYSIFLNAICLFAKQNVTFIDTLLVKCDSITLTQETLEQLEELYLKYRELVDKLNSTLGTVPLWCLVTSYTNVVEMGTMAVLFHGKSSATEILAECAFFLVLMLLLTRHLMNECNQSYDSMESFRQKGLKLINCQLKRIKVRDPMCECLSNTLRGLPLMRMKAGQMYDMDYSIMISIMASAIPMTVMIISLMREMK